MTSFFTIWEVRGSAGWDARCNAVSVRANFYLLFPHIILEGTWRSVIKKVYTIRLGFLGALPGWECLIPVSYVIATNTAGDGTSLTASGDKNPGSLLDLP